MKKTNHETILCLLAVILFTTSKMAAVDFSAIPSPIIFQGNATNSYRDPAVIYHDGVFRMFYTFIEKDDEKFYWFTAESQSTNLINWTPPHLLTPKDLNLNFSSPGDVIQFSNEWVLCLQTYPRPNGEKFGNANARLWVMRSRDLDNWSAPELLKVKGPDVPVGKMGRMIDAFLLQDKDEPDKWWCFYKQNGISLSWSHDLKNWTFAGRVDAGENPCVLVQSNEYVMFHSPRNGIGVKCSKDLKTWRDIGFLTLGQAGWPWARGRLTAGFVLDLRAEKGVGKYIMFFHGSGPEDENTMFDNYASLGIAWSDDLINWTWPGKTGGTPSNSPPQPTH